MTSLADELAADFDDDDVQQDGNDELDQNGEEPSNGSEGEAEDAMDVDQRAEDPELKTPAFDFNLKADKVTDVAKLINNTKYQQLVQHVEQFWAEKHNQFLVLDDKEEEAYELSVRGRILCLFLEVEKQHTTLLRNLLILDCAYLLFVAPRTANEMAARILDEIRIIHKFVRDKYALKFPELEQLVPNPMDYIRVVQKLKNETDIPKVALNDVLPQSSIITISLTASITPGKPLSEDDLQKVLEACDMATKLDVSRTRILSFVESRMQYSAPNLTAVVGSTVAAQLIGAAGGINKLANMPSCNVEVLGKKKATLEGFAAATTVRHVGFIMNTDTVKGVPFAIQRRVARLVAGKATLAARIDLNRESRSGEKGQALREEVERKTEKMQEPPPPRQEKALPAPDEKHRKRRGGKRYRKQKAQMAMTELRKRANRMAFGSPQEEFGNDMKDLGMLGSAEGSGLLRIAANYDGKGFKVKSKKHEKTKGNQTNAFGFNTASGIATSMYAFTPVQGLELRTMKKPATKDQDVGYFSTVAGFTSVKKP